MVEQQRGLLWALIISVATQVASTGACLASCNQIPGTVEIFRGVSGSCDRPFAGPGDFVELRASTVCRPDSPPFPLDASQYVVSVVFTPHIGRPSMVILATNCAALDAELDSCSSSENLARVGCIDPSLGGDVAVIERDRERRLQFRFPDTDALFDGNGDNSDNSNPNNSNDLTLAGPATIAVTRRGQPLPCGLASRGCDRQPEPLVCLDRLFALDGTCGDTPHPQFSHFTALPPANNFQALCVAPSPPCTGENTELRLTIDADGNLLFPVDWIGVLLGQKVPIARLLRGSTSEAAFPDRDGPIQIPGKSFLRSFSPKGGPLPPLFEPQFDPSASRELTLFGSADAPKTVLWLGRRGTERKRCVGGEFDQLPCNERGDCPAGQCGASVCVDDPQRSCTQDSDCLGGECGPSLFDFRSRARDGIGPIVLERDGAGTCQSTGVACSSSDDCNDEPCVRFRFRAEDPVPLDGLIESPGLFVSVVPEAIARKDLNGDDDQSDNVVLLHDRRTGLRQPIGQTLSEAAPTPGAQRAPGRAATRINQPPFVHPAVIVEDDILAFLEAEPLQASQDANHDGDRFDSILRVFRSTDGAVEDLTGGMNLVVEAAPSINGRSVAISNRQVFFRTSEAGQSRRRIRRASVSSGGMPVDGPSERPVLSGNGRHTAFESSATNLTPNAPSPPTMYLHDGLTGSTSALTIEADLVAPQTSTTGASLSDDGRYVATSVRDIHGIRQIFVHDRDTDQDAVFDEPDAVRSILISINSLGETAELDSRNPSLSADGRFVAFLSRSHNLVRDLNLSISPNESHWRVLVHDRDRDRNGIFDDSGLPPKTLVATDILFQSPTLAADGSLIAFSSVANDVVDNDDNDFCVNIGSASTSCGDAFLTDLRSRGPLFDTSIVSRSSAAIQGDNSSSHATLAAAGQAVVFESAASNLVAGDTNGANDVYVRDLASGTTQRVSVASDGAQANANSAARIGAASADGRIVVFASDAINLTPGDSNQLCEDVFGNGTEQNCTDVFIHDRLTGFTERISVGDDGRQGNGRSFQPFVSADGESIAFQSDASNLTNDDGNGFCGDLADEPQKNCTAVFVSEPDAGFPTADLNGDGDVADTVLRVLDTRVANPDARLKLLGPAETVQVDSGRAIFLVPESQLANGGSDRNGDDDATDHVAHLYPGEDGAVINLGVAGTRAALSQRSYALLVSEADQGGIDRNGDTDIADSVLCVGSLASPDDCHDIGEAADEVFIAGDLIAILTPEAMQNEDLNNDGDLDDRVLQFYDLALSTLINTGIAAADAVAGPKLIAFRTPEHSQSDRDLNKDGDSEDLVMHVLDVESREVINSEQAAIACQLEACDPRLPYRVLESTVRFLTLEAEQGEQDLDGNGDRIGLVLQSLVLRPPSNDAARSAAGSNGITARVTTLGAVSVGICSDTGDACVSSDECTKPATCYLPPGRCVEDLGVTCRTDGTGPSCGEDQFCVPTGPGLGTCHIVRNECSTDDKCNAPARCQDIRSPLQRVIDPFASGSAATFTGAGLCIEDVHRPCDDNGEPECEAGQFCTSALDGHPSCHHSHGPCTSTADCPNGARCRAELITAVARDSDGDEMPDPFDNCRDTFNPNQADGDRDGIGDACQLDPVATPTALATIEPTVTLAPPAKFGDDGCQLETQPNPSLWAFSLLWVAALLRAKTMTKRHARLLLVLAALACATPNDSWAAGIDNTEPTVASCSADCDGSSAITVDELLRLVNLALGQTPLSDCLCADANTDGAVTVDEVLNGVDDALHGCVAPPPQTLARAVVSLVRSLSHVPVVAMPVSLAIGGAGPEAGACPITGHFENSCSEPALGAVRIPVDVVDCEVDTPEGRGVFAGVVEVSGYGSCPDVLSPINLLIEADLRAEMEDLESTANTSATFDLDLRVRNFALGPPPCQVVGADGALAGDVRLRHFGGNEIGLNFATTSTSVRFEELRHDFDCEPGKISASLIGPLRALDSSAAGDACAVASGFTIRRDRRQGLIELDGRIASSVFGGAIDVATVEPIGMHFGELCLRGGELQVVAASQSLRFSFATDGVVRVEGDGIDLVLDEFGCGRCGDGHVDRTEQCDDGNSDSGDGCSAKCLVEECHRCDGAPSTCEAMPDGSGCDDGIACTGTDRCRSGTCAVHSQPCLIVLDTNSWKVISVDVNGAGTRLLSDRNLIKDPGGIALEAAGTLLVSTNDDATQRHALVRIHPRTGAQSVAMELGPGRAGSLVAEPSGSILLASRDCCAGERGAVRRVDLENRTETIAFANPPAVAEPRAMVLVSPSELITSYLYTYDVPITERGRVFRTNLETGESVEIAADAALGEPLGVAVNGGGEVFILDRGAGPYLDRLFRIDPATGDVEEMIPDLNFPFAIISTPGSTLFLGVRTSDGNTIVRVDTSTGAVLDQLAEPERFAAPHEMLLTPVCGNGAVEIGETCDDGNLNDGDLCSSLCVGS